jgi:hypothetical protein
MVPSGPSRGPNGAGAGTGAPALFHTLTIADMPMNCRAKGAPRKFRGNYKEVVSFLRDYELLLAKCSVNLDENKCALLERYVSESVWEVVEGLPAYEVKDWEALKTALKSLFNAQQMEHKYVEKDLKDLVRKTRKRQINDLNGYKRYHREIITVAGWLRWRGKIGEQEERKYFWKGLPTSLKPDIITELKMIYPRYSIAHLPTLDQIDAAAEELFRPDRFNLDDSDNEAETDTAVESDESNSDNESEAEIKIKRKTKKTKHGKKKSKITVRSRRSYESSSEEDSENDEDRTHTRKSKVRFDQKKKSSRTGVNDRSRWERELLSPEESKETFDHLEKEGQEAARIDEVEALAKQMEGMTLRDNEWNRAYTHAIRIAPQSYLPMFELLAAQRMKAMNMYVPPERSTVLPPSQPPALNSFQLSWLN